VYVLGASDPQHVHLAGKQKFRLPKFRETLIYHEILWDSTRYGIRPEYYETISNKADNVDPSQWLRGTIVRVGPKFGFISTEDGELHYFQPRNLAVGTEVGRGARVVFHPLPPVRGTKQKRAEDVFITNTQVEGVVSRVNPKGWGFVRIRCANGLEHELFALGVAARFAVGDRVSCRIGSNDQGPIGLSPELSLATAAD
jgi:hypothetical protein